MTIQDQPAPEPNESRPIWGLVVEDMLERDTVGRERYGTPLQAHNGRDALVDAYQESLDLAVYLRQAIAERAADVDPAQALVLSCSYEPANAELTMETGLHDEELCCSLSGWQGEAHVGVLLNPEDAENAGRWLLAWARNAREAGRG